MKDYVGKQVRQKRPRGKNGECRDTAKVTIVKNGIKRVYSLGRWGSREAENAYNKLMVQFYSGTLAISDRCSLMGECFTDYALQAEKLKMDTNGGITRQTLNFCVDWCGELPCSDFSLATISFIKDKLLHLAVERDWTKHYMNKHMQVLKHILTFGVLKGWLNSSLLPIIKAYPAITENLKPLNKRKSVPDEVIEATLKYIMQPYADIVRLIRSACLRPIEILRIRKSDIVVKDDCWIVKVKSKTARYGYERVLVFNKKEQEILKKWIREDDEVLFHTRRGNPCTVTLLGRAIMRALEIAEKNGEHIPKWTAYQLRHTAFTENVKKFGVEVAAKLAGHSSIDMARIYDHSTEDILIDIAHNR